MGFSIAICALAHTRLFVLGQRFAWILDTIFRTLDVNHFKCVVVYLTQKLMPELFLKLLYSHRVHFVDVDVVVGCRVSKIRNKSFSSKKKFRAPGLAIENLFFFFSSLFFFPENELCLCLLCW